MLFCGSNLAIATENKAKIGVNTNDFITVIMGLILVLLIIFGCAWLAKRVGVGSMTTTKHIKVLAVLSVGSRERITLIEVGGKQLLVGVTANNISTLHSFNEPVINDTTPLKNNSEFAQKLRKLISSNE